MIILQCFKSMDQVLILEIIESKFKENSLIYYTLKNEFNNSYPGFYVRKVLA